MLSFRRSLIPVLVLLTAVVCFGTLGYVIIEGWPLLDALYMTAITLTTVGFGEIRPLSSAGRLFTILLIFFGVSAVAYGLSAAAEYVLATELGRRVRRRQLMRTIRGLKNHVIVCGYGRVGRASIATLTDSPSSVVIIEHDESIASELTDQGMTVVHGDGTRDETLRLAGIERARGLIVCTGNDSVNLFIVLSARALNPELSIVARSVDPDNEAKMKRAGANRVVSPYQIGGRRMAHMLVQPKVIEFLDYVTLESGLELGLEEITVGSESALAGQTVVEADLRRRTGTTLVALLRPSSGATISPDESTRLEQGDHIIVLGTREQLAKVASLARA